MCRSSTSLPPRVMLAPSSGGGHVIRGRGRLAFLLWPPRVVCCRDVEMAVDTGWIGCSALDMLLQGAGPRPAPSAALSPVCEEVVMSMSLIVGTHYLGQTSWWLNAENHRVVAWAGRTFDSTIEARRAADDFKKCSATAEFEIHDAAHGRWRWRAWHSRQQVAVSATGFTTKQNARRAAETVRAGASASSGP